MIDTAFERRGEWPDDVRNDRACETGLLLEGIDGANPLAFLAALGTLRGLTIAWPQRLVQMSWEARDAWRPRLLVDSAPPAREEVLSGLAAFTDLRPGHEALSIGDDLSVTPDVFRGTACQAAEGSSSSAAGRSAADFIAGFGCEAVTERNRGDVIQDTALRTLRGAGHQHFLKTMRDLTECAAADSFDRCLFQVWMRSDRRLSLRWDPEDDRRYALRWRDPSKDAAGTEWGANRLAFEAIPLFPVAPVGRMLATTGFHGIPRQRYLLHLAHLGGFRSAWIRSARFWPAMSCRKRVPTVVVWPPWGYGRCTVPRGSTPEGIAIFRRPGRCDDPARTSVY